MFNYATVSDFWYFLDKHREYTEFTDINGLQGDIKEYERLFALDLILQALPLGGRMLEIGGGVCQVMSAILKRDPVCFECWSVDPVDGQLGGPTFKQASAAANSNIKLVTEKFGSSTRSVPADYFDCCFSLSVLQYIHLQQWESWFQEMVRVCKPGGLIFHTMDIPLDTQLAANYLYRFKRLAEKIGLQPLNLISFEVDEVAANPDTLYLTPHMYTKWLNYMPSGQNTLTTGVFKRITAFNAVYRAPYNRKASGSRG